jgi:hypothetical protein
MPPSTDPGKGAPSRRGARGARDAIMIAVSQKARHTTATAQIATMSAGEVVTGLLSMTGLPNQHHPRYRL